MTATAPPRPARGAGQMTPGLARRHLRDRAMTVLLAATVAATIAVLAWVLVYVASQGLKYLGPSFFTETPPGDPSQAGGGYGNSIIGSLIIVGIATGISVPLGIAAAVAIAEYGGRLAALAGFLTDVLVGIPTIVIGAFIWALWVTRFGFSGLAGAFALAIVMLPLVIRASAEMLRLVPGSLREASAALGATQARTVISVVLPTARSGLITGVMLAVARAMGETAPLLLTTLGNSLFYQNNPTRPMSTLSLQIFTDAITGFRAAQARAWAGALTLIGIVLILTIAARLISRRAGTMN
ncbi:MAG TPA: phosphate ABC transporter permease PstA [Streptosporangiaceae bacterium]